MLRVIPVREWTEENINNPPNIMNLPQIPGDIETDFRAKRELMGAFKTAHLGHVISPLANIPDWSAQKICVKQFYWHNKSVNKTVPPITRYSNADTCTKVMQELGCLDWATMLLNLAYRFIEREVEKYGPPPKSIPKLRYVRAMFAELPLTGKCFLIEEWIDSATKFVKYINNGSPVPCVPLGAAAEVHQIAEFLSFAQHAQYNETGGAVFTSDYQGLWSSWFTFIAHFCLGVGDLLTDPQIISNP